VTSFLQHKLKFAQPRFNITCYASGQRQSFTDMPNPELFDALKRWRDIVCEETGLPIYMVANQATLREIATFLPVNKRDLLLISGFGKAKVDKYGDDILAAVDSHCNTYKLVSNMAARPVAPKKERKQQTNQVPTDTKMVSFKLFQEGKSVAEIAAERHFATATIESHLAWYVGNGDIEINTLVPVDRQSEIKEAVKRYGSSSLKTLIDNLPADVTYGEVRFVLAAGNYHSSQLPEPSKEDKA
jgi:ribonuclease D